MGESPVPVTLLDHCRLRHCHIYPFLYSPPVSITALSADRVVCIDSYVQPQYICVLSSAKQTKFVSNCRISFFKPTHCKSVICAAEFNSEGFLSLELLPTPAKQVGRRLLLNSGTDDGRVRSALNIRITKAKKYFGEDLL